jgi:hypothetical protein
VPELQPQEETGIVQRQVQAEPMTQEMMAPPSKLIPYILVLRLLTISGSPRREACRLPCPRLLREITAVSFLIRRFTFAVETYSL